MSIDGAIFFVAPPHPRPSTPRVARPGAGMGLRIPG